MQLKKLTIWHPTAAIIIIIIGYKWKWQPSMAVFPIKRDAAAWFMEVIIQFSQERGYSWF